MTKTKPWQVLKKRTVFKNRWRRIDEWNVRRPNGTKGKYYYTILPDVVIIFGVTEEGEVVLNDQYYIYGGYRRLELPAGYCDKKETPLQSAKREFLEETGYLAKKWIKLGSTSSGKWNNYRIHYFLALGGRRTSKQKLETSEDIKIRLAPIQKIINLLNSKQVNCDLSVSGCYLVLQRLGLLKLKAR